MKCLYLNISQNIALLIKEVDRLMHKLAGLKHVFITQKERFNSSYLFVAK